MNFYLSILMVLATGMIILMTGILTIKTPGQSLRSALSEGLAWGTGLFLSYGAGTLLFVNP